MVIVAEWLCSGFSTGTPFVLLAAFAFIGYNPFCAILVYPLRFLTEDYLFLFLNNNRQQSYITKIF